MAQRTRELGIRLALGTTPIKVRRLLLGRTLMVVAAGSVVGAGLMLAVGRHLHSLIAGAEQGLLATLGMVIPATVLIGAAAVWAASRRIAHLDIADVLRAAAAE